MKGAVKMSSNLFQNVNVDDNVKCDVLLFYLNYAHCFRIKSNAQGVCLSLSFSSKCVCLRPADCGRQDGQMDEGFSVNH